MRRILGPLAAVGLLVALVVYVPKVVAPGVPVSVPVTVHGGEEEQPLSAAVEQFDPSDIVTVLGYDAIPAIDDPGIAPGAEADLDDEELVIGVEIGGEARAYPIRVLSSHEIVNDEIAGRPIAVTW